MHPFTILRATLLATLLVLAASPPRAQRASIAPASLVAAPAGVDASLAAGLVGDWWEGSLSTLQFYDPTTGTWAAPNGVGTFLMLRADGTFRAGGILNTTSGGCTSTLMVDERGTYTTTGTTAGTLTLARQTGHSRLTMTCTTQIWDETLAPQTRVFDYSLGTDAQGRETLTRTENGEPHGTMRRWESGPPPDGSLVALRHFEPGGVQTISLIDQIAPLDTGFVYGSNAYGDRQKATLFTLPGGQTSGQLAEVDVYFAHERGTSSHFYGISVYAGTAETGPTGDPLAVHVYSFDRILSDGSSSTPSPPTVHRFETPVAVGRQFFVSVRLLPDGYEPGLLAVASTEFVSSRVAHVWEQWSDGTWHNVSDSWWGSGAPGSGTVGAHLWVEARVAGTSVADEPGAPTAPRLVLSPPAPNPARDAATLSLTLAEESPVRVEVLDVTGRTVRSMDLGLISSNTHRIQIDTHSLSSGLYVVRVSTNRESATTHLTISR